MWHHSIANRREALLGLALGLAVGISSAGCQPGEELGHVTGRVTFSGQPVDKGNVVFAHLERQGIYIVAPLGDNGAFEVDMAQGRGLPLGKYGVAICPPLMDHPLGPIAERPEADRFPHIPRRYREVETSGLTIEVGSGENHFPLDMRP